MILKKLHFPIFVLLALFLILQSCEKKTIKSTNNQNDIAEINTLLAVAHKHFKNSTFDA